MTIRKALLSIILTKGGPKKDKNGARNSHFIQIDYTTKRQFTVLRSFVQFDFRKKYLLTTFWCTF